MLEDCSGSCAVAVKVLDAAACLYLALRNRDADAAYSVINTVNSWRRSDVEAYRLFMRYFCWLYVKAIELTESLNA